MALETTTRTRAAMPDKKMLFKKLFMMRFWLIVMKNCNDIILTNEASAA
jgi:hypothetical protein